MSEFDRIEGIAAPLPIANLDTDQIMPKQFLLGIDKSGLVRGLLHDLRFAQDGTQVSSFVLNQPAYAGAKVLIGGSNFGCGSSREHAVWGLLQYGIAAVLAPSFGEIFRFNAVNNRLLTVALPQEAIDELMQEASDPATAHVAIDVVAQTVRSSRGRVQAFDIEQRHKRMFLEGLDALGATLSMLPQIEAFEKEHRQRRPWACVMPTRQPLETVR